MAPTRTLVLAALLASAPLSSAARLDPAPAHTVHRRDDPDGSPSAIAPGTACPGREGEWNCLGRAWQRCASGRWSDVRLLACGTACTPAGRGDDFSLVPDPDAAAAATVCSSGATTAAPTTTTAAGTNASCASSRPASSSTDSNSSPSSSSVPGGFTSGSAAGPLGPASRAQNGRKRMAAAVVGIGTAAVVFARLLM